MAEGPVDTGDPCDKFDCEATGVWKGLDLHTDAFPETKPSLESQFPNISSIDYIF